MCTVKKCLKEFHPLLCAYIKKWIWSWEEINWPMIHPSFFIFNQDLVYFWSVKTFSILENSYFFFNFFYYYLLLIVFILFFLKTLSFHPPSFLFHFLSGLHHIAECRVKSTHTGFILSAFKFWFYHCIHCTAYLKRPIRCHRVCSHKAFTR